MATSASRTIKSAHRVLEILEYFDQDRRHATVMDMSRTLNYPQSSTSELLRCMTRLGYLHYNRVRRTYSPTARVALLGAWVKPALFRGGPVLSAIDEVAKLTNETVTLSSSTNYVLQHLHVIQGNGDDAIDAHAGDELPILHSPQGRLLLSTYNNEAVRSAVHRLNAEELDRQKHVRVADLLSEFMVLRDKGWIIERDRDGVGSVTVLLPHVRQMDRLSISVLASPSVIDARGQEILDLLLLRSRTMADLYAEQDEQGSKSNVVRISEPVKIVSYRRHFA
ncbi:helix-turn-helix domain-containing protein [Sphingobium yanoikuyae]|uniref:IclR family transcriptional regulator n=1 Tax=Sphingobium yanoikuyae TaxID=13690 RepID=A0A291N0G1_SPHYA|nr:helix-turn-helix domain-containing protein [Sphingobium yanoikuyae]ATI80695.1 IclR family transcriptional regulator [Sphingobium yanoikuyae]